MYHRRRREGGQLRFDHEPQLATKGQDNSEIAEEGFPGRCLDEPVVPVTTHTDTQGMKNNGYRSQNPREDLRGRGQTEAQRFESVRAAMSHKAQEATRRRMHRNLKIRLPKIDGGHQIPLSDWHENRLDGYQAKVGNVHETIEHGQVEDRTPRPRGLPNHKPAAGKAGRGKRSKLHSTLGNHCQGDPPRAAPLMEVGAYEGMGMSSVDWVGGRRKGMWYPSRRTSTTHANRTPVPPGLPGEGQTATGQGRQGDGSHFQKWEPTPYHPWSSCGLQSARRTQSAAPTAAPDGTVARGTGERRRWRSQRLGIGAGGQSLRHSQGGGNEGILRNLSSHRDEERLIKQTGDGARVTMSVRFCSSGIGTFECVRRDSRRLERRNAAVRAWKRQRCKNRGNGRVE